MPTRLLFLSLPGLATAAATAATPAPLPIHVEIKAARRALDTTGDGAPTGDKAAFLLRTSRAAMSPKNTARITLAQLNNGYRLLPGAGQESRNLVPRAIPFQP